MLTAVPPPDVSRWLEALGLVGGPSGPAFVRFLQAPGLDAYLPWDKVRHKTPPPGLTVEEWWCALKLKRAAGRRPIPLRDRDGRPFGYCIADEILSLTDEVSRRAGGSITLPEQVTTPGLRDRYIVSSLMEEAITSSQLEGASTSRKVAREMLRSGRPARTRSERMIMNNYNAMQFVREHRHDDLSAAFILQIHQIVTEGTLDHPEMAGRMQSDPDPADRVSVFSDGNEVLHSPPPVAELPQRMEELCAFANATSDGVWLHPILRALTLHFMMGFDHYFEDGNGRTARAVFYWSMLRQDYWLAEFLAISRVLKAAPVQYARSFIDTEQDDGDLTYFFIHHLHVLVRAIDDLQVYLARKAGEVREARTLLASYPGVFNNRQVAVIESALKDATIAYTAQSHATSHDVSMETARQDLLGLESRGVLIRRKQGKMFVWESAADMAKVLRKAT